MCKSMCNTMCTSMCTYITLQQPTKDLAKVPHHGFLAQRFTMAGSEPLFQEADPLLSKLNIEYECWYKMVQ